MKSKSAYAISREPLVIAGSFGLLEELRRGSQVTVLYHPPCWLHPIQGLRLRRRIRELRSRRDARVIVCTNERREAWGARLLGLDARWHNQNIHVRECVFRPESPRQNAIYDAVYAAALYPYKRLPLAAGIERLYVVTYKIGMSRGWNLHNEVPALKHASYNREFLGDAEVNRIYGAAFCGLALSHHEGAMWASMEYLMSGLPVVSTWSAGGRRQFRDPLYWREVPAQASAVASAVAAFKADPPDRALVRDTVLKKVAVERRRFARMVCELTRQPSDAAADECQRIWGGQDGIARFRECSDAV